MFPNFKVPNIGQRTMYGLSGLRVLDLSYNRLTNVVEQNFDGLYSLKHLCLANNHIKSMVSAAFRHVQMLETLSLKNNQLTGKKKVLTCIFIFHLKSLFILFVRTCPQSLSKVAKLEGSWSQWEPSSAYWWSYLCRHPKPWNFLVQQMLPGSGKITT